MVLMPWWAEWMVDSTLGRRACGTRIRSPYNITPSMMLRLSLSGWYMWRSLGVSSRVLGKPYSMRPIRVWRVVSLAVAMRIKSHVVDVMGDVLNIEWAVAMVCSSISVIDSFVSWGWWIVHSGLESAAISSGNIMRSAGLTGLRDNPSATLCSTPERVHD